MTAFANQTIGSFDDKSHEYVSVWYDETIVSGFRFHSVGTRDVMGHSHRVFGMSVDARNVWSAVDAFNNEPNMAVRPDGQEFFCVLVHCDPEGITREFRMGSKYGKAIARMVKTGYVQPERKS